ncbi:MAG: InlB B-repeat-containing protein [Treponema sp.]|nr:InlB B-repeat-containing protein [Treponema sp.]
MKFIRGFIALLVVLMPLCICSCENPFIIDITDMYMVSFETDCPQTIDSYRTKCVEKIEPVQKYGSTFCGWYTNASFIGNPVTFPFFIDADTVFYAKWKK